jgi:glycosyltransferase 2 family protein
LKKKLTNFAKYALGLLLGGLFLYLAFKDAEWSEIVVELREVSLPWVLLALSIGLFSHFLRGVRWQMQLKASGYQPGYLNLFAAVMVGYLVNQALPRAGELARCTSLLRSDRVPLAKGFGTVVIERVFDLLILVVLISLAFALEADTLFEYLGRFLAARDGSDAGPSPWLMGLGIAAGVGLLGTWWLRHRLLRLPLVQRFVAFGRELWQAALSIRYIERPWLFILYTLTIWLCYWMMTYVCFFAIDSFTQVDLDLVYLSLVTTVMGGIGMAMPVPGGTDRKSVV